jgi:Flp pilus assembly protein TadG
VYQIAANGGAVVDADLFASAFVMTNGPTSNVDVTHESGQYTVAERSQPLWQALGLSSDPNREYDIAATITTDFNGGQNYRIDVLYTL